MRELLDCGFTDAVPGVEMRSLTASPSVNMVTVNVLLSVFFTSGALAACSQDSHLFITAPQVMEALSGSCLLIPCNFTAESGDNVFDNTRQVFGVWIKSNSDENNVIFNSSGTFTKYPMSIIGNLSEKNCTTLFSNLTTNYRDTYYFRIMNWPYRATAVCDPLQINVTDSAPSPIIKIPGDVKEKESVTITCSALTPCPHSPTKLTWNLQQDPHTNIVNTNGTFTTKIQETITLSDRHDGSTISCSATYPVNGGRDVRTAETQETLRVSYAPKDTSASISPSGSVSAGTWVNLSCSSRAQPPVSSFTWFKSSKDGARTVSEGAFYSFNATQGGVYYCVAANDLGNQTSALIQLIIGAGEASLWPVILGGIFGVMVLLCLIVCGWRLKSTHSAAEQTQHQTCEDLVSTKEKHEEEDIHYGEIHFSSLRAEASSGPVQDSGQQQDTVYGQVKVSERQVAAGSEQLYAEVKTK